MYQQLTQWLIPQGSSPEETSARIDALTEQYPFFSAAHFLRLKHADPLASSYAQLAQRAALDFPHPILLQLTLAGHDIGIESPAIPETPVFAAVPDVVETSTEFLDNSIVEPERTIEAVDTPPSTLPSEAIFVEPLTSTDSKEDAIDDSDTITITHLASAESMPPLSTEELAIPTQPIPLEFVAESEPSALAEPTLASDLDVPLFEPLHTTDYFASVGIKITDQPVSNDQLGQQLRRFTEWLRVMKKLHPSQHAIANTVSPAQEQQVIRQAEASNQEKDVLTEAMAEVLVQQGRIGKAVEVYEKLSLNYPAKSAYFAAKINELKG